MGLAELNLHYSVQHKHDVDIPLQEVYLGNTIWFLRKSKLGDADNVDLSLFYNFADILDGIADKLEVAKLSEFFDFTDLEFNLSDEELPESWISENQKWFSPQAALTSICSILKHLKIGKIEEIPERSRLELIEELEDCLTQLEIAIAEADDFQFCIVM